MAQSLPIKKVVCPICYGGLGEGAAVFVECGHVVCGGCDDRLEEVKENLTLQGDEEYGVDEEGEVFQIGGIYPTVDLSYADGKCIACGKESDRKKLFLAEQDDFEGQELRDKVEKLQEVLAMAGIDECPQEARDPSDVAKAAFSQAVIAIGEIVEAINEPDEDEEVLGDPEAVEEALEDEPQVVDIGEDPQNIEQVIQGPAPGPYCVRCANYGHLARDRVCLDNAAAKAAKKEILGGRRFVQRVNKKRNADFVRMEAKWIAGGYVFKAFYERHHAGEPVVESAQGWVKKA